MSTMQRPAGAPPLGRPTLPTWKKLKQMNVFFPPRLLERLRAAAAGQGRSMSSYVVALVERELGGQERQERREQSA